MDESIERNLLQITRLLWQHFLFSFSNSNNATFDFCTSLHYVIVGETKIADVGIVASGQC